MTAIERIARAASWILAVGLFAYLIAPLVVTILVSFGSSPSFVLPAPGWTARWYQMLLARDNLVPAIALSFQIAFAATGISLVVGTMSAIGLVRSTFPGREAVAALLVSPLMLPGIVLGVALLHYFRAAGLFDAKLSLLFAHTVITLPYIVRIVYAALQRFDFALIDAARTLGCTYPQAVVRVMLPALAPAFGAAGMFSILASLDNYPVSIFLTDARNKTLPIQVLQYLDEQPDPSIAALAAAMIFLTLLVMILGDRLVGIRRMASF
jgi:putative spermidine/putrescine transport system permease protein